MNAVEILSPAGSMQSLIAAVRSGADAVYIGATQFSARRNAENFDKEGLKEAAEYCRIRGVKLYLTLNIMIKNSELETALELASYANEIGIDGLIIEDIGLALEISRRFPDLPLHASTQMTIYEISALPLLKRIGFKRVVLAREMSKGEISAFCAAARKEGIEVEVFVHGALCMCVSGQCLLSSVLGSRSGNRGLCAGPCRLPFSVIGGTGYDLSLKDLSLLEDLKELTEMGVTSFKIEGRMKRPEYVAAATSAARQMVDNGRIEGDRVKLLSGIFSRSGFTKGYYQNHIGRDMFGVRTKDDVISSTAAQNALHELYRTERQSVPVKISVTARLNAPLTISFTDGINTVSVSGEMLQAAKGEGTSKQTLIKLVSKLGGTPYFAKDITVNADSGIFVPSSAVNSLRRKVTESLNNARKTPPLRRQTEYKTAACSKTHTLSGMYARFYDTGNLPDDLSALSGVILPLENDFSKLPQGVTKIADMPRLITNGKTVALRLKEVKEQGVTAALCGNLSAVFLAKSAGLKVIGDIGLNIANDRSAEYFEDLGLSGIISSAELTLKETEKLSSNLFKGIFAYGRLPLMLTKNCPIKNGTTCDKCRKNGTLRDRKGILFPVRCRQNYSEVFNSSPVYLADRLGDIKNVDFLLLSFTDETKVQVQRIIKEYKMGGITPKSFTRGLYYKGVK